MQKIILKCNGGFCNKKNHHDYVIATGEAHSVREFINIASKYLGIKIYWKGKGFNEVGYIKDNKNKNKNYYKN